jgi:hypothetical protein
MFQNLPLQIGFSNARLRRTYRQLFALFFAILCSLVALSAIAQQELPRVPPPPNPTADGPLRITLFPPNPKANEPFYLQLAGDISAYKESVSTDVTRNCALSSQFNEITRTISVRPGTSETPLGGFPSCTKVVTIPIDGVITVVVTSGSERPSYIQQFVIGDITRPAPVNSPLALIITIMLLLGCAVGVRRYLRGGAEMVIGIVHLAFSVSSVKPSP